MNYVQYEQGCTVQIRNILRTLNAKRKWLVAYARPQRSIN